ncbi:cyclic nucleotide-binding domain-containing protein [Leptospira sp. GIMC2001]|uniref:cyclic nucleotide-binding domain-containing protein n=1 Tax=Leptospira sp. GIMC2001 TaxID=1513297 RepID=UPI00234A30A1|nr:cyclic nucleotide-binding domain-containing protein [Leptospira sp. GIMC2001]WCL51384.1 cyclic nucleotide-binding domain-containing protein [Leptospira sp. GIMC2001]
MPIDTRTNNQKLQIQAGEVLFLEGSPCNSLNILHEGNVSFEKKIGESSIPLYILPGPNVTLGANSLLTNSNYNYTIRSRSTCILSTYAMNASSVQKTLISKLSLGMMIARTSLKEISEFYKKNNQVRKLSSSIEAFSDNLSLVYYLCNPSVFPDIKLSEPIPDDPNIIDPVIRLVRDNLSNFQERGGRLPDEPNTKFLEDNMSEFLFKTYLEEIDLDDKEFHFIRKILNVNPKIQGALFESDPSLMIHSLEKLSDTFTGLNNLLQAEAENLQNLLNLYGGDEYSLIEKYLLITELLETGYSTLSPTVVVPIMESVIRKGEGFYSSYKSIFGSPYLQVTDGFQKLKDKTQAIGQKFSGEIETSKKAASSSSIGAGIDISAVKAELQNSASQILNYASLPAEAVKEFSALMIKLKSLKNPLDSEPDIRKLRRNITKTYWDVYRSCFVKNLTSGTNGPKPVQLMMQFGFFDESLLDDEHIGFLASNLNPSPRYSEPVPVHYGTEWLNQVYNKQVPTSIDELGQTFFEKVKLESKDVNYKKESDLPPHLDSPEARLAYEMQAMYEPNARLTSGGPATHLPILTRYHVSIPLDKCFVTKENVYKTIMDILNVDYTAFNREIIYKNEPLGIRSEFIQKSVIPDLIVIPSIGPKIMMWQDLSIFRGAGSKESRGRIIVPHFVTGDLKTMLLETIAAFRWELCKNILGPDWNNVGMPSITADYTDYVQFFKKNKDLSIEIKEKLSAEFKRFRTDRDKFANDYLLWMKYESEGVQRLNRVVRAIFYRHIPFHKDIRDKISTQPAYMELQNRFKNIRSRQHKEHENRYKKYANEAGMLPDVLQENLNYYLV